MSRGTLVIGASQAGLQIATSLRELGDRGPITLLGDEAAAPYQRPPLSKDFLAGDADASTLGFRKPEFYAEAGITLMCGERVTSVTLDPDGMAGSGVAETAGGRALKFDRLALAVGGHARRLEVAGSDLAGICYLRTIEDAVALRSQLRGAARVVVVGGGFIGLEAAAVARKAGKQVTVVEAAERLLARAVAPAMSDFYHRAHTRRGTRVVLSTGVSAFEGTQGRVTGVRLADGSLLEADVVVVGVGLVAHTELAEQLGLKCDGGIVVDSFARTTEPFVVAAGDCTVLPHPLTGVDRVRLESVQNAVAQGRAAAATLMGRLEETRSVPWFWSDQDDLKLQIAGLNVGYDDYVVRGEPDDEQFSVLYYGQGRLLAVDAVNRPIDYMTVRKALTAGATIERTRAGDPGIPLKNLITG
jgi:3-phenylpropionate/trans-cinnamate dioxygenase ferredoxin reductase subunit